MKFGFKMKFLILPVSALLLFQSCSKKTFTSQETLASENSPIANISYDCTIGSETIAENTSKQFFLSSSVPFSSSCQSENRICTKGYFTGSYQYTTCAVDVARSCLYNGATMAHGQSVTAYRYSSVQYGNSCTSQVRTCNDGILSGNFVYTSCSVGAGSTCLFNGTNVPHASDVTAFETSSLPFGDSCQSETRTCTNGSLNGTYTFASCAVDAPASCLFNGVTIPHGGSTTAYSDNFVPSWMGCNSYSETRTCYDGNLDGSYPYDSCSEY